MEINFIRDPESQVGGRSERERARARERGERRGGAKKYLYNRSHYGVSETPVPRESVRNPQG